jgi:uncharacterized protein
MYSTEQVLQILRLKKQELQKRFPISEMALFGSYARGDNNEQSDIDILVDFNEKIDGFDYIRIAHELEDTFNQKIDLVSRNSIRDKYLPFVEKNLVHV